MTGVQNACGVDAVRMHACVKAPENVMSKTNLATIRRTEDQNFTHNGKYISSTEIHKPQTLASPRNVKDRGTPARAGSAVAVALVAAVMRESAVRIGHKCRTTNALVTQMARPLKGHHHAPAASACVSNSRHAHELSYCIQWTLDLISCLSLSTSC